MTWQSFHQDWRAAAMGLLLSGAALAAQADVTVTVPGHANPNTAGRAPGYACCSGDTVEAQGAVLVPGLALSAGQALIFAVSGQVSYGGGSTPGNNPDGSAYTGIPSDYGNGITAPSGVNRIDALVGVFLTDAEPTAGATPTALSFVSGLDFLSVTPLIGQIFFIGNGLTGDTAANDHGGLVQQFVVPTGATRLYLGTSDGYGWYNNSGAFQVSISAVPEPSALALLMAGGLVSLGRRRRLPRLRGKSPHVCQASIQILIPA